MKLRPHQIQKSRELLTILLDKNVAYLAGEVRSGKTLTALNTADLFGCKNLLFITKKKAISSIQTDYENFGFTYNITIINYESLHKLDSKIFDLVIYDEAHSMGAYPKPSKRTKLCKQIFYNTPTILMSGTPAVESYSQLYHQFFVSKFSPFNKYVNFYKWANVFVIKKQMKLPTHTVTDYSNAKVKDINAVAKPYFVKMTQQDAGLTSTVTEEIINIETPLFLTDLANQLLKDRVIEGNSGIILGDAPAKLQSKVHQIINGHCIIERSDTSTFKKVFSNYKAKYIKGRFKGLKIAVMYYYQSELEILKREFGDGITTDLEEFNTTNKNFALQQSSSEGMNVSKADAIVYMNLGFSGKNYLQSRDRLTVKGRKDNRVFFICENFGMTKKILKTVQNKQDFNSKLFMKWHQNYKLDL
jgi:hypothetical protein